MGNLKERKRENGTSKWKSKEHFLGCVKKSKERRDQAVGFKQDIGDFGAPTWYHEREPAIFERDICSLSTEELLEGAGLCVGECSVISAGFPCQGFSLAGERMIDDPRNRLYKEFVRIVDEAKPAALFGENVPGLVSMKKGDIIRQICQDLAHCGYDITWDILDAANFGVPQHRKRVIIIGKRVDITQLNKEGRLQLYIGALPGKITHPKWFQDRFKSWKVKLVLEPNEEIKSDNCKITTFI